MRGLIGIVFGGPSPEHDVSILTGLQVGLELTKAGENVVLLYWSKTGDWYVLDHPVEAADFLHGVPPGAKTAKFVVEAGGGFLIKKRPLGLAVAVNCCHGGPGEDGTLQGLLDLCMVPYTGPSAIGAALGIDKLAFSSIVSASGHKTLPRVNVFPGERRDTPAFEAPFIVKPRYGGSSIGIEVVENWETVLHLIRSNPHFREGGVVEPFVRNAIDLSVGLRTYPALEVSPIERPLASEAGVYTYLEKYAREGGMANAPRELPANIPDQLLHEIQSTALSLAPLIGARGLPRLDFLWSGPNIWVNEVNTIPGSLSLYLWQTKDRSRYDTLMETIEEAIQIPARQLTAFGADGAILRAASSIASKLG